MNKIIIMKKEDNSTFEDIKRIDPNGNEYWFARKLMSLLKYSKWENFHKVIKNAMVACENSDYHVTVHFPEILLYKVLIPKRKMMLIRWNNA